MSRPRLLVAVGEASGDRLAAALVTELRRRRPDIVVEGVLGPGLRECGATPLGDAATWSALGVTEAVAVVPRSARLMRRVLTHVQRSPPAVMLTVDAPEVTLRLGRRVRAMGIPVVHWVSPQIWAWRPGRVARVAAAVNTVMCLFPFEPPLYAGRVRAVFTGHPAAAVVAQPTSALPGEPVVALCPGSRPSEVDRLWPVMRGVARELRLRHSHATFVVPLAPTIDPQAIGGLECHRVGSIAELGAVADVAVVASGTATLELAALGIPQVVVAQVSPVSAWVVRRLAHTHYVSLPNIVAARPLVPEHLQQLAPHRIAADVVRAWRGPRQVPEALLAGLRGHQAITRAADEVGSWLRA